MERRLRSTIARRKRLHNRYATLSRLPDASRLAYLKGPEQDWTLEEAAALWSQADPNGRGRLTPQNNLYLHVPFCKSICSFCNYERLRPTSPQMLERWEQRLFHSIDVMAPAVDALTFHSFYMGGGTPSVLPPKQLKRVLVRLNEAFNWHPKAAKHFEFDPAVMNAAKLDVLSEHGVTHFSFGIQTLRSDINAAHNRGNQSLEMVAKRFGEFHAKGIEQVSCDFLAGLAGTTPEDIVKEVEQVVRRFHPAWVDLFMITPTAEYIEAHFHGSYDAFYAHLAPFQEVMPEALKRIAKANQYDFLPGQGHHLCLQRKDSNLFGGGRGTSEFSYSQLVSEAKVPVNLLGLGPSARSQIFGVASLQNRDPTDNPLTPGPSVFRGHLHSLASEAVTYLAHDLRDTDVVDRRHFQDLFGQDIQDLLPTAIEGWTHEGAASLTEKKLRLAPHGRQERTKTLLWMVDEFHLEHDIARHMALDLSPTGLSKLLAPLPLETRLADGVVLEAVSDCHIHLRVPHGGTHRLRVSPPMDEESSPTLMILTGPSHQEGRDALMRAVQQLQKLVTRNHVPWVPDRR